MLKLKKIAITGGVASGKTSVCQIFQELGAYVVHTDSIVHELLKPDTDLGQQIIRQFGPEIIENEQISRRMIAEKAFKDPKQLQKLEDMMHPAVLKKIEELYSTACKEASTQNYRLFVVEIPLLFEIGATKFYDVIVAILADEAEAKKRFQRLGFAGADYDRRMQRQLKPKEKGAQAHYILYNNGSLDDLRREVIALNHKIHQQPTV